LSALLPEGRAFSVPTEMSSGTAQLPGLKNVKEFCVGLLENPENHPWWDDVRHLSLTHRTTIAGTLFLARKTLPVLPSPWEAHRERICSKPSRVSNDFLRFVRSQTERLFGSGWDGSYLSLVSRSLPPLSATTSHPRSKGGARAFWHGHRQEFIDGCLGRRRLKRRPFRVRFANIDAGGKSRSVTVADGGQHLLSPLHQLIYNRISREDWLLRGAAKASVFDDFGRRAGQVFVSGDYESATDNLSTEVAVEILRTMSESSTCVPGQIWALAQESLRCEIEYPDGSVGKMVRGQLMGNLLSFPLLCLQNYFAFRYLVRDSAVPVKINGDDIVFRATEPVAHRWMSGVSALGLTLCAGKTMMSPSVFSLNSTFFRATSHNVRLIPVLRSKVLSEDPELPSSVAGGLSTFCRGATGELRVRAETLYLRRRRVQFCALGRSVKRDLRARVTNEALSRAGMIRQEAFYLSLPPCPLPPCEVKLGTIVCGLPRGWSRVPLVGTRSERSALLAIERSYFGGELVDHVWDRPAVPVEISSRDTWEIAKGTGAVRGWRWWASRTRSRSGITRRFARACRLRLSDAYDYEYPAGERKVWVDGSVLKRAVRFVRPLA